MPHLMAWLTIVVELVGGMAVFTGPFVPLVSVPLAAILLGAGPYSVDRLFNDIHTEGLAS